MRMYVYLYTSVEGVIVVEAIQYTGSSTMTTQNNERSVSYMTQEQIYDIVVIGSGDATLPYSVQFWLLILG
jgi:hypothetical protein